MMTALEQLLDRVANKECAKFVGVCERKMAAAVKQELAAMSDDLDTAIKFSAKAIVTRALKDVQSVGHGLQER